MHKTAAYLFTICLVFFQTTGTPIFADGISLDEESHVESQPSFQSFTGKITREKVRMRLQPSLDCPVIREVDQGDMMVVSGEEDGFYAVQPPLNMKGYVYRTFVLDGVIEGNRVNVRLDPHLEAPVIAQLNQGDPVTGVFSPVNNKWLEIPIPLWTRFYVFADYVDKIGDASLLATHEKRKGEVYHLLNETRLMAQVELKKPVTEMNVGKIINNDKKIIAEYEDFPECVTQAQEHLSQFQEAYLKKKVAYLEAKTQTTSDRWNILPNQHEKQIEQAQVEKEHIVSLEKEQSQEDTSSSSSLQPHQLYEQWMAWKYTPEIKSRMASWVPIELSHYEEWAKDNDNSTVQGFYDGQHNDALALQGILESYDRSIRNKPGDFVLVNRISGIPMAYLYSTQVNLKEKVGQEIAIVAAPRPNHYFAYPAYFVLSVE